MNVRHQFRPEIRAVDGSNGRQFWAMPLAYEVVDDYGTIWTQGVFTRSVEERMPTLLYGHDWSDVTNILGRAIDYRDLPEGPQTLFELTDFDAHPHTRQVAAQINEGTMVDMSVGFDRRRWAGPGSDEKLSAQDAEQRGPTGVRAVERMYEADWDETSLVVRGAVPGAKVLSGVRMALVRLRGEMERTKVLEFEHVVELAKRKAAGELTDDELNVALELLATDDTPVIPEPEVEVEDVQADDGIAEAAEALEALET
jgi:HK97 family phage prohead protease